MTDGLWVVQPRPGYRFSTDPFLLAGWVAERGLPGRVLDVGTGSGVLGLLLARLGARVHGLDARSEWAPHAMESARRSGLAARYSFEHADIRSWEGHPFDLVVSNPPYFEAGTGHLPPDPLRAFARHALQGTLAELLPAMSRWAPRVAVVLPAAREQEARALLERTERPVVRSLSLVPRLVLLEGCRGGGAEASECAPLREGSGPSRRVVELYSHAGAALKRIRTGADSLNAIQRSESSPRLEAVGESVEPAGAEEPAKS